MKPTKRISAPNPPGAMLVAHEPRNKHVRLLGLAGIASVLLAGCGGSANPSHTTAKSAGTQQSRAIAYSQCMRSHGVRDFPDPNGQGQIQLQSSVSVQNGRTTTTGGDLNPSAPAFRSAERACGSLSSIGNVTPAREQQQFVKALKAARCMRANGVPNFPDSKLVAGSISMSFNNVNPRSPAFHQAAQKCGGIAARIASHIGGGPPVPAGGGS